MSKVLCLNFFHIFLNLPLKYSSLYAPVQIILKSFISKSYPVKFPLKEGVSLR